MLNLKLNLKILLNSVKEIFQVNPHVEACYCVSVIFSIIYDDGHTEECDFDCVLSDFDLCFKIIRNIIPNLKDMPEFLNVNEDFED